MVLLDRDEDRLMSLAQSLGPQTTTLVADITDAESVRVLPAQIPDQFGPIAKIFRSTMPATTSVAESVSTSAPPMIGQRSSKPI